MIMKHPRRLMLNPAILVLAVSFSSVSAGVIHVDQTAPVGGDGQAWATALQDLQSALDIAVSGDQIWVASGAYFPSSRTNPGDPRTATFQLASGVQIFGSFPTGGGDGSFQARDVWNPGFATTLSGDIQVQGVVSDNAYNVVTGIGTDSTAVLDGFVIRDGNANGSGFPRNHGGGLTIVAACPRIANCIFIENRTDASGGGGAMSVSDGSSPVVLNCRFLANQASDGGAIICRIDSNPTIAGCTFIANSANDDGAGIYCGSTSAPFILNCSMYGNSAADQGGAIYNENNVVSILNSLFWENGDEIATGAGVTNATYSCVQGGYVGIGNISDDPMFLDPDGADDVLGTLDDELQLSCMSPCIDAGNTTFNLAGFVADAAGNDRQLDNLMVEDSGIGDCPVVDMGSFENQCFMDDCENAPPTCEVDLTAAEVIFLQPLPACFVVTEGETISVTFVGEDPDGDDLTAALSGLPNEATLSATSGSSPLIVELTWTPSAADKAGAPYTATVTFTDPSGESASCSFTIEDINLRPTCSASMDLDMECTSPAGEFTTLDGSASDEDDDDGGLTYTWDVSDLNVTLDDPNSPSPSGTFPIGVTMATLTVADGRGGVCTSDVLITVEDTTPPEVMCTTDRAALWPPNHKMRSIEVIVIGTDECTAPEDIIPLSVTVRSDEPDNVPGNGDGNTTGDVNGYDGFSSPVDITGSLVFDPGIGMAGGWVTTIELRAERAGNGDGRSYIIDVEAVDSHGNLAEMSCVVVVPHDRRN